ncbi:ABC transporter ATP-binding protein [Halosolutus amylolyticus]|uniref:Molybdate/tungstate import ATP-binding protein WtpC n=1 Tax=Halosolutus amylolyticus TaxID=2932267 RepID=A0ABD5PJK6_9EURY|nr:ABC transporter ATP-binding protein [Halosolutus amylolyticus]
MTRVEIRDLRKEFGSLVAVDDVSLTVKSGELLCLLGPSGCGKSTTLRMLSGLETPTSGTIELGEEDVTNQPPYQRDSSMVFQSWALFPYKTVLENVAFGLKMKGADKQERREKARETLELMQIEEFADSVPTDLSGGQQQRVALARSLALNPKLLLLDEPLSNLDKRLKEQMQIELKNIHDRFDKTMVHVTHDQNEAFTLADRIGIMNEGRLVQVGPPREVYNNPANRFVEEFLGETNFVTGTASAPTETADPATVDVESAPALSIDVDTDGIDDGDDLSVSLRPEAVSLETPAQDDEQTVRADGTGDRQHVTGTVENIIYRGSTVRYYIDVDGVELFAEQSVGDAEQFEEQDTVQLSWDRSDLLCFDGSGATLSS